MGAMLLGGVPNPGFPLRTTQFIISAIFPKEYSPVKTVKKVIFLKSQPIYSQANFSNTKFTASFYL